MDPMVETVWGKKEAESCHPCVSSDQRRENTSLTEVKLGSLDFWTRDEVES